MEPELRTTRACHAQRITHDSRLIARVPPHPLLALAGTAFARQQATHTPVRSTSGESADDLKIARVELEPKPNEHSVLVGRVG